MKTFFGWVVPAMCVWLLLIAGYRAGSKERREDRANDTQLQPPSHAAVENGLAVLVVDTAAQRANGIATAPVAGVEYAPVEPAIGVVLSPQSLVGLDSAYVHAQATVAQTAAAARASRLEYRRLQGLNRDGRNASDKAVEAAQTAAQSDEAAVQDAQRARELALAAVEQQWGGVVAGWVKRGSPPLTQLLRQRSFVVEVTATDDAVPAYSETAIVTCSSGRRLRGRYLSPAPAADPRLQRPSFLYLVPAAPGVVPGITVDVDLAGPRRQRGAVIPSSAIVHLNNRDWCYVAYGEDRFVRRPVGTAAPFPGGWFVARNFAAGERVVTRGAQLLLSEEFRQRIVMTDD